MMNLRIANSEQLDAVGSGWITSKSQTHGRLDVGGRHLRLDYTERNNQVDHRVYMLEVGDRASHGKHEFTSSGSHLDALSPLFM